MSYLILLVILNMVIGIRNITKYEDPIIGFCCLLMSILLFIPIAEISQ